MPEKPKADKKPTRLDNFFEVLSMCGDPEQAAQLVGVGMEKAYRALRGPDGFDKLDEANKNKTFYSMSKEQRKSFLTGCILGGILPRVVFDKTTGIPTSELVYEPVGTKDRLKCLELLGKMEGDFIDRKVIGFEEPPKPGELTPEIREKVDEIYTDAGKKKLPINPLTGV